MKLTLVGPYVFSRLHMLNNNVSSLTGSWRLFCNALVTAFICELVT